MHIPATTRTINADTNEDCFVPIHIWQIRIVSMIYECWKEMCRSPGKVRLLWNVFCCCSDSASPVQNRALFAKNPFISLEIPRPRTSDVLLLENHGDSDLETEARAVWVNSLNLKASTSVLYKYPPLKTSSKHSLKIVGRSPFPRFFPAYFLFSGYLGTWWCTNQVRFRKNSPVSGSTNSGKLIFPGLRFVIRGEENGKITQSPGGPNPWILAGK